MTKKVRNILAVFGIILYCIANIIYASEPIVKYVALIVLGLYEIGISIIYCIYNKQLEHKDLKIEVVCNIVIFIAILFVLFKVI